METIKQEMRQTFQMMTDTDSELNHNVVELTKTIPGFDPCEM